MSEIKKTHKGIKSNQAPGKPKIPGHFNIR